MVRPKIIVSVTMTTSSRFVKGLEKFSDSRTSQKKGHEVVTAFLKRIGVNDHVADVDSEGMEHHVSKETLAARQRVLRDGLPPARQ